MDKHLFQKKISGRELDLLRRELKNTKDLCNEIAARQNSLHQLVTKLSKMVEKSDVAGSLDLNSEYFSVLFSKAGRPMKMNEIIEAIKQSSEDVIPIQIINIRSYLSRRLNQACREGVLIRSETGTGDVIYRLAK